MQRIGFIAYPGFQVLSLCTVSVFECANMLAPEALYELQMLSEAGGNIRTSCGLVLETKQFDDTQFDTLIVLGTLVENPTFSPGLVSFVKNAPRRARRVASICTGALVLAEAGLLENRRATTHWAYAHYFRDRFPNLNLEEDRIFIIDDFDLDVGRVHGLYRSRAGHGRERRGKGIGSRGIKRLGYVPSTRRRPNTTFRTARTGAKVGPHPERVELCAVQSPQPFDC